MHKKKHEYPMGLLGDWDYDYFRCNKCKEVFKHQDLGLSVYNKECPNCDGILEGTK